MSATGTVIMAGLGGVAGVFAANVVMEEWTGRVYDRANTSAVGAGIGAALGTIISVMVEGAEAKKAGTLSGPPQFLGFP